MLNKLNQRTIQLIKIYINHRVYKWKIINLKILMNQLLGIIKSNVTNSPLDVIFYSNPQKSTFQQALLIYKSSPTKQKIQIQNRAFKRFQHYKQPKTTLAALCLLDFIISQGYQVNMKNMRPTIGDESCRTQKLKISQSSFVDLYYQFLCIKVKINQIHTQKQFDQQNLVKKIEYCENAIKAIFKVIMADFLIQHCLIKSQNTNIVKIIVSNILYCVSKNLKILKKFIENYWSKILESDDNLSFRLNEIYQKCIFFGKKVNKLQNLNRKSNCSFTFCCYSLDSQVNIKIERRMYQKRVEKIEFISQKYLKDKKQYQNNQFNKGTPVDLVSQSSIIIDYEQSQPFN